MRVGLALLLLFCATTVASAAPVIDIRARTRLTIDTVTRTGSGVHIRGTLTDASQIRPDIKAHHRTTHDGGVTGAARWSAVHLRNRKRSGAPVRDRHILNLGLTPLGDLELDRPIHR